MTMTARAYAYAAGLLAIAVLVLVGMAWLHHYGATRYAAGETAGRNAVIADDARAAQQAQSGRDALDRYAAAAGGRLQHNLGAALPIIEGQTHASVEHIRTIYSDRPVADAGCQRPDGVQAELDAAVDAANATAAPGGDLRPHPATAAAAPRRATAVGR